MKIPLNHMQMWNEANPGYYEKFTELLIGKYPTLHQSIVNDRINLKGVLYLTDCDGKELDHYQIKIVCPINYPSEMPAVFETAGKIPKIPDRHFIPQTTEACLLLKDEVYKYYNQKTSITEFIEKIVEPFFLSQSYYERTGKWLFGERSHGVTGILEFYEELLGTNDIEIICKFLNYVSNDKIKGHFKCFCGSNQILRKCHFGLIKEFRSNLSMEAVQMTIFRLNKFLNAEKVLIKRSVGVL